MKTLGEVKKKYKSLGDQFNLSIRGESDNSKIYSKCARARHELVRIYEDSVCYEYCYECKIYWQLPKI